MKMVQQVKVLVSAVLVVQVEASDYTEAKELAQDELERHLEFSPMSFFASEWEGGDLEIGPAAYLVVDKSRITMVEPV